MRKTHDFILLCGLPGSGKSTWCKDFLLRFPKFEVFSTDDLIDKWAEQNQKNYSEAFRILNSKSDDPNAPSLKKFEKEMFSGIERCITENKNLIVDRTNMSAKVRKKFLEMVPENYVKTAVVFQIQEDELKRRLKKREEETGKSIPSFVLETMSKSYQQPTPEEFDKIIFVEN